MAETNPSVVVSMPTQLFTLARAFKAAANGRIYIGKIDTDPTIPENQIQAYLENEDGSSIPVSQPMIIGPAGFPVYNGQIAKFTTTTTHSMAVYDAYGVQQFYFPNVLKYDPGEFAGPGGAGKIGIGYPEGTQFNYTTVKAELGYSLDMFGGDPTGATNSYDAMTRAIAFFNTTEPTRRVLKLHGKYVLEGPTGWTLPPGMSIVGNHEALTQGPQTDGLPYDYAYDATLIIKLPAGVNCFTSSGTNAGNNVLCGFSVIYQQPSNATSASDFIQYGWFLYSTRRSAAIINVRYVGAWNFAYMAGECPFVMNTYGYAINKDFHVFSSADVGRFLNVHINPNVTRPAWAFIDAAAMMPTSCAFYFEQHDGIFVNQIHVFGKNVVFTNRQNGGVRLCTITGENVLVDKCGTLLVSDVNTAMAWRVSSGTFISRYCTLTGGVMLTNPVASQVTSYQFDGWKFQIDDPNSSPATGPLPLRWFNFGSAAGARVQLSGFLVPAMPNMEFNNATQSNVVDGEVTIGATTTVLNAHPVNLLANSRLTSISPDNVPYGFSVSNNVTVSGRLITSSVSTPPNGVGLVQRKFTSFTGACTAYVFAGSIGDSTGITVTSYLEDFQSPIGYTEKWVRQGSLYVATVRVPNSTNRVIWDVCVNAPSATGGTVNVVNVVLAAGNLRYITPYTDEPTLQPQELPVGKGKLTLVANTAQQIPTSIYAPDHGVIHVYAKTALVTMAWVANKRLDSLAGTITNVSTGSSGGETLTLTWPAGVGIRPTLTSTLGGVVDVAVIGV
ncbi:phage head-binding domain-containing protein [Serratia marcescens]|uniref:phage head-binding domain-containing protein n=1 Tax=Serratia marcescens TaxID=615 RepID=UPI0002B87BCE|nr:phage head-binding domain-containing protein [Serratia marcescens]EMF03287.1 P22 tailspike protein head-binding protein [Serratia marcescens VGH107]